MVAGGDLRRLTQPLHPPAVPLQDAALLACSVDLARRARPDQAQALDGRGGEAAETTTGNLVERAPRADREEPLPGGAEAPECGSVLPLARPQREPLFEFRRP